MHPLQGTFSSPFFCFPIYLNFSISLLLSECVALFQHRAVHPCSVLMREVGVSSHWLPEWTALTDLSLRPDTACTCACSPAKRRLDPFRERACLRSLNSIPLFLTRLNAARGFCRQGNRLSLLIRAHQTSRTPTRLTANTKPTHVGTGLSDTKECVCVCVHCFWYHQGPFAGLFSDWSCCDLSALSTWQQFSL